jgi:exosortase
MTERANENGSRYFYIPAVLLIVMYIPVLYELVINWYQDPNYSHGFLVPFISGFLIWRKRRELSRIEVSRDNLGLVIIAVGMVFFILGNAASEYFTARFSLVVAIFGLVLHQFGRRMIRRTWFELVFLCFMIPIPYVIYFSATFPMQLLASKVSVTMLDIIGMPALRQGNIIHLPEQSLEVAEACSGLRSIISLLAMGAIYAYLSQKHFWGKVVLFLITIPIAVLGNIFRVFITSIIVYTLDINVTDEPMHSMMGASVFVVAFILLVISGAVLRGIFKR